MKDAFEMESESVKLTQSVGRGKYLFLYGVGEIGALMLRPPTVRPPVQFFFRLGGPIDPQRAV
jgi:hypothetical protein